MNTTFIQMYNSIVNYFGLSLTKFERSLKRICLYVSSVVKIRTLRWFGYIKRMEHKESVKKVYRSSVEGPNRRGRPLGRCEDRVKEYVSERGEWKIR